MSVSLAASGSVVLLGEAVRGNTLRVSATLPDLSSLSGIRYEWSSNGLALLDQISSSLILDSAWVGQSIRCAVSYPNLGGQTTTLTTEASSPIAPNSAPEQLWAWPSVITAIEKTSFAWTVPVGSVQDPEHQALAWSASLKDGKALPAWLRFDADTLTLKGVPDLSSAGHYSIVLSASDPYGLHYSSAPLDLSVLTLPVSSVPSLLEFRNATLKDKLLSFDVYYVGHSQLQTNSLEFPLQLPVGIEKVTASKNPGWTFMTGTENSDLILLAPSAKSLNLGNLVSHFDLQLDTYLSSLPLTLVQDGMLVNSLPAGSPSALILSQPETPHVQKGVVQDGYLVNALVWVDANGDGQWTHESFVDKNNNQEVDEGEYVDANGNGFFDAESWTLTDAAGSFDGLVGQGNLKIQGWTFNANGSLPTVDLSTGKVFNGSYSAPDGASVINPITTLLQSAVSSGMTSENAQILVKSVLGVSGPMDLLSFDPVIASQNTSQATDALKIQKAALQVANLMQVAVDTASAAGASNSQDVVDSVANTLVAAANATASGGALNLGSAALMSNALTAAADSAFTTGTNSTAREVLKSQSGGIGTALAQVNTSIDTIVNSALAIGVTLGKVDTASALLNMVAAQIVSQEQVSAQAQNLVTQAVILGDTSVGNSLTVNLSQSMGLALSKVGQVFVSHDGAAPLAVNDQIRLSLPGKINSSRDALSIVGSVLNNDTADVAYSKTVSAVSVGTITQVTYFSSSLLLAGSYGNLLIRSDGTYAYTEDISKTNSLGFNQVANDVFSYQISDASGVDGRNSTAHLTIAIDRINQAPIVLLNQIIFKVAGSSYTGDSEKALNLLANVADPEGDPISVNHIKVGTLALGLANSLKTTYGQLTLRDGVFYYVTDSSNPELKALNEGQSVKEFLTYDVSDGTNLPTSSVLQLVIQGTNDAPQLIHALADETVSAGNTTTFTLADNSFYDVDDNSLVYTATLASGDSLPAWLEFNSVSHAFTAHPGIDLLTNASQVYALKLTVTDSGGLASSGEFNVTILPPGFDIAVTAHAWHSNSNGVKPSLYGVNLSEGGVTGKTNTEGNLLLHGVEDKDGANDGNLTLAPQLDPPINAKSAITLTDVLAALKVYLNKPLPDAYSSPLNYIAADFDGSGTVTLTDVLQLLKYYLGKSTTVSPSWQFVDAADMSADGKTFAGANGANLAKDNTMPHAIDQTFDSNHTAIELVGVLRGDVDGSWTA